MDNEEVWWVTSATGRKVDEVSPIIFCLSIVRKSCRAVGLEKDSFSKVRKRYVWAWWSPRCFVMRSHRRCWSVEHTTFLVCSDTCRIGKMTIYGCLDEICAFGLDKIHTWEFQSWGSAWPNSGNHAYDSRSWLFKWRQSVKYQTIANNKILRWTGNIFVAKVWHVDCGISALFLELTRMPVECSSGIRTNR